MLLCCAICRRRVFVRVFCYATLRPGKRFALDTHNELSTVCRCCSVRGRGRRTIKMQTHTQRAHCAASVCKLKLELNGHVWGNHLGCRDDLQESTPLTQAVSVCIMYTIAPTDNANACSTLYKFHHAGMRTSSYAVAVGRVLCEFARIHAVERRASEARTRFYCSFGIGHRRNSADLADN